MQYVESVQNLDLFKVGGFPIGLSPMTMQYLDFVKNLELF